MQLTAPSFYIFTAVVAQMMDILACTSCSIHRNQIITLGKEATRYFETLQQIHYITRCFCVAPPSSKVES
jgi:hypothetical protein